jgi:hypothetical protein
MYNDKFSVSVNWESKINKEGFGGEAKLLIANSKTKESSFEKDSKNAKFAGVGSKDVQDSDTPNENLVRFFLEIVLFSVLLVALGHLISGLSNIFMDRAFQKNCFGYPFECLFDVDKTKWKWRTFIENPIQQSERSIRFDPAPSSRAIYRDSICPENGPHGGKSCPERTLDPNRSSRC